MNENEQRDELASEITGHPIGSGYYSTSVGMDEAREIADAILAAGYSKPRTITTVEELDALPDGSVVLDRNGLSLHKMGPLGMWNASNCTWDVQREELESGALPATVLHEPTTEATR